MKNSMRIGSTYRTLFLLNLLFEKRLSKDEIIELFKTQNISITKSSINNYLEKLSLNGINFKKEIVKKTAFYKIEKQTKPLALTKEETDVLQDAKKLLISTKEYNHIRIMMRVFYKFAKYIADDETKETLLDFGYYSTINWTLLRQLEKHCENKDIIEFDYIMPDGKNKYITMHTDSIRTSNTSQRIYLRGVFKNSDKFSNIPIDRIYMVKKIVRKKVRFKMYTKPLIYITTDKCIEKYGMDGNEKLIGKTGSYCSIGTIVDDEFYIIQRLLNFSPDIYYISDEKIKKLYLEKLAIMKDSYDNKCDF